MHSFRALAYSPHARFFRLAAMCLVIGLAIVAAMPAPASGDVGVTWTGAAGLNGATVLAGNGFWDTAAANWTGISTTYSDGDAVTFDNTGTNTNIAIQSAGVNPLSVTFNKSAVPYTFDPQSFSDTVGISGSASVTLSATAGSVTFNNVNTYTGPTTINGGTLRINQTDSVQDSTVTVNVNGGLLFGAGIGTANLGGLAGTGSVDLDDTTSPTPLAVNLVVGSNNANNTYSGNLSGAGSLTKTGSGTQILSGTNNSYSGGTNVNVGTLEFALPASQSASGTVTVAAGATLAVATGGSGWNSGQIDALRLNNAPTGASFANGAFLGIDTTNAGGNFSYNSSIADTSNGPLGLAKLGTGTLTLGGTNTFTGGLAINTGSVIIGSAANLPAAEIISGPGVLQITNGGTTVLSGNNSNFSGGIFNNVTSNVLTLQGATAGGTGNITYAQPANQTSNTVNLLSDTSATFSPASLNFNTQDNYNNSRSTINVGPITTGVTNQMITLNSVTLPNDQDTGPLYNGNPQGFFIASTAGSGYTLGITTLNATYNDYIQANTTVAIGTMSWYSQGGGSGVQPNLAGAVGGSVGSLVNTFNHSAGSVDIWSGTWTFTGANSYGNGPWTNNVQSNTGYGTPGGTEINGASTTLVINQDLSLGVVPGSAQVNNIGLVAGGTLRANASFTLNANRGIGIGNNTGSAGDIGTIDVANGQTLTYNGIIASSGTTGTVNLTTTPSGGTLILGGHNTYNGTTTVNAGTLRLNNSTLTTGTGMVMVGGSGTLGGVGTINGPVAVTGNGILSPGTVSSGSPTGIGSLTINNTLSLGSTSNSNFYINSVSGVGPNDPNLTVNGNSLLGATSITYGGALNIAFAAGVTNSIFVPGSDNAYTFQLFPATATESGTFSSVNTPNLGSTYKWTPFDYSNGTISVIAVVPPTQPSYTLAIAPATFNAHIGATVNLTTTIENTGGAPSSDSFTFAGLGAMLTGGSGGTIGGPTGGASSDLLYKSSGATSGLTYTNSAAGTYTLIASVGSAVGDNASGNYSPATATLSGTAGTATIAFYTGQSNWTASADGNWSSYSNWDAGGAPGVYASNPTGDSATFGSQAAGAIAVTVDVPVSITTLNLQSTATSYTIAAGAGSLTMNNGAGDAAIIVVGTQSIAAPMTLASNTTITTANTADVLSISGAVGGSSSTLSTAGPGLVVLSGANTYGATNIGAGGTLRIGNGGATGTLGAGDVTNNGTLAFNRGDAALVVSNSISGTGAVNQIGSGMTTLSGTNSYGGGTNVNAGTLEFALFASQPTSGTVAVAPGATLVVGAGGPGWTSAQIDALLASPAPTGATFASGALLGIDATNATGGTFTYNSNITDTSNGPLGLVSVGSGTLVLGGANSFTGGLFLNGSGAVSVSSAANLGGSTAPIAFNGGTLRVNGAGFATSATNAVTIGAAGGTINVASPASLNIQGAITGAGLLTLNNTGNVILSGNNINFTGGIFNNTASNILTLNGANAGGTGNITYVQNFNQTSNTVNLYSDTSALFSVASLNFSTVDNYSGSHSNINVGPITNGVTGQTITLNSVTEPSDQDRGTDANGNGFVISSTAGSGYTLAINTLHVTAAVVANTNVAIGNVIWNNSANPGGDNTLVPIFAGSVGGTVAMATAFSSTEGGIDVTSGTWTFTGANSYGSGKWTSNGNSYGSEGTLISGASTTLVINQDASLGTVPGSALANNIGLGGGGTLRANASFTLNANRGIGIGNNTGSANDSGTIDVANGQILTYNGIIASSGTTGAVNLTTTPSGGTLILGGANTQNSTAIAGGALIVNSDSTSATGGAGTSAPLGQLPSAAANNIFIGAIGNGGTLEANATYALNPLRGIALGSSVASSGGTIAVTPGNTLSYSGVIADNGGPTGNSLTVAGGGTLLLGGANTYSGGTNITASTLRVANATSTSATGTGAVSVNAGGTLAGNGVANQGFIAGTVTVASGGTISPSSGSGVTAPSNGVGTLNLGGLTLDGGANLNYQINSSSSLDAITVNGALSLPTSSSAVFNFFQPGTTTPFNSFLSNATYQLMTYQSVNGNLGDLSVNSADLVGNQVYSFTEVPTGPSSGILDLNISSNLTWTGAVNNNWDTSPSSDTNWSFSNPAAAIAYTDGTQVAFADKSPISNALVPNSAGLASVTIQSGGVSPNSISFTNTGAANGGVDYSIGGGPINGSTGITLSGTGGVGGNVYLASANAFSGAVAVNVGQLILQNGRALGNSTGVTVASGAALVLQSGSGTTGSYGSAANGSSPIATSLSGSGSGGGALVSISGINTYSGAITLAGNTTIGSASNANGDSLTLSGGISNGGNLVTFVGASNTTVGAPGINGAGGLTYNGSGILSLAGTNNYQGPTLVSGGALQVNGSLTQTSSVSVGGSGTLGGSGTITSSVSTASGGQISPSLGLGSPTTLSITGNLTLADGSVLGYLLSNAGFTGSDDTVSVMGNLSLLGGGMVNIFGSPQSGTYTLISYTGTASGSVSGWSVPGNPNDTFSLGGGQFDLTVSGGSGPAEWIADNTNLYSDPTNWSTGSVPSRAGQSVTFGTGSQNPVIVDGTYTVGSLNFSANPINGPYFLASNSAGASLTLNDGSGGGGAQINVGANSGPTLATSLILASSTGTTTVTVDPSTTLSIGGFNPGSTAISGSGQGLALTGGGTLVLTSPNTYSGPTSVNAGILQISGVSPNQGSIASTSITVGAGATLQLVGTTAGLPSTATIKTQGTGTSGDGAVSLSSGATQTVGVISGDSSTNVNDGTVTYAGNTTVGDGSSASTLTAAQILQNTLTINANSTVTISPSGPGIPAAAASTATAATSSASSSSASDSSSSDALSAIQSAIDSGSITSARGQHLENRIAAIEELAASNPAVDESLLDNRVLAMLPPSSVWSSSGSTSLAETGSGLLALDGSSFGSSGGSAVGGATASFASGAASSATPASVPEPSTLLLAALGGLGFLLAARRRTLHGRNVA